MIELNPEQKYQLNEIGKKFNLRFIILHGSYVKGTPYKGSDLDIALVRNRRINLEELLQIHAELADVFGDNRDRELDLKTLYNVDPLFRYLVTREGALLYGNPTDYEEFKAYAFRDYMDTAGLRNLELQMTKAKQELLTQRYAK